MNSASSSDSSVSSNRPVSIRMAMSGDAFFVQQPQRQQFAVGKAEPAVHPDGTRIVGVDVQEWRESALERPAAEQREQALRITAPAVVGMRAHRAHLLEAVEPHAFSGHGREPVAMIDAEILAHLERARTEEPR